MSIKKISKDQPKDFEFNKKNLEEVKKAISNYPKGKQQSAVMALLYIAQKQNDNWIPLAAMKYIAKILNMPYIKVYEVATFYSMFNLSPVGKYFVQVCTTTPCMIRGAKKIVESAADYVINGVDVVVEPLVMPVGAINSAGLGVLNLIKRLREELKVNTTCGASNMSFGLPNRHGLNSAFLSMAMGAGMTSAIMNPLHQEEMTAIKGADVVMGVDPECRRWIKTYREPLPENKDASVGARKRRRRRQ